MDNKETEYYQFNLNSYIKVKIYDKGYEFMAKNHNKYLGRIPNWVEKKAQDFKDKADENGYTKFQAWAFIEEFGEITSLSRHGYYSIDIRIESKYLEAK